MTRPADPAATPPPDESAPEPSPTPIPNSRVSTLIALFEHRWAVPILAELGRRDGAKFITLAHATGASPGSVRLSLNDLISRGWVIPNSGYGHPLRPEYLLTPAGERLAPVCVRLDDTLKALHLRATPLRKWSVPVLDTIAHGANRFGLIARRLGTITDRALSLTLTDLRRSTLVERRSSDAPGWGATYTMTPQAGLVVESIIGLQ